MIQVSTRSRDPATETRQMDVHTGHNSAKSCKARKRDRKVETEAHSLSESVSDEELVTKRKHLGPSTIRDRVLTSCQAVGP